jgi:hypothetical protein
VSTPPGAAGRRENIFTHKIGPLPMWVWLVITAGALLAYAYYKNKQSNLTTQPANDTNASQVPQFVNQTYTTVNPPSTPGTAGGSPGGAQVDVPNVVGMTDTAGDAAITAAGLKVVDKNEKKGGSGGSTKITGQSPAGGTMVARGSSVEITLGTPAKGAGSQPKKPAPKKGPAKPQVHPRQGTGG